VQDDRQRHRRGDDRGTDGNELCPKIAARASCCVPRFRVAGVVLRRLEELHTGHAGHRAKPQDTNR
jgi:hypothetical protein